MKVKLLGLCFVMSLTLGCMTDNLRDHQFRFTGAHVNVDYMYSGEQDVLLDYVNWPVGGQYSSRDGTRVGVELDFVWEKKPKVASKCKQAVKDECSN